MGLEPSHKMKKIVKNLGHSSRESWRITPAGHTNIERGYLPRYADRIRNEIADLEVILSAVDGPVFTTL